jgi:hypothetical protein
MELEKQTLARWQSRGGRYWTELYAETLPGCAAAFSYRSDDGGGYLGHCAPEVAMQHAARQAGFAPSKMPRIYFNETLAAALAELV